MNRPEMPMLVEPESEGRTNKETNGLDSRISARAVSHNRDCISLAEIRRLLSWAPRLAAAAADARPELPAAESRRPSSGPRAARSLSYLAPLPGERRAARLSGATRAPPEASAAATIRLAPRDHVTRGSDDDDDEGKEAGARQKSVDTRARLFVCTSVRSSARRWFVWCYLLYMR